LRYHWACGTQDIPEHAHSNGFSSSCSTHDTMATKDDRTDDTPTNGYHMEQSATCWLVQNCVRLATHINLQGADELLLQGNCATCLPRCMDSVLSGCPEACSPALKCSGALCKPSHAPMVGSGRHNANDLTVNFKQEGAAGITAVSADARHIQEFTVSKAH